MNSKKVMQAMFILTVLIFYFCNTDVFIIGVKEGLLLCYNTVIPSLFVFMVLASIISSLKHCDIISIPFTPLFRLLNIFDRKLMTYCILGILGGFATGGQFLKKISEEYSCDKNIRNILTILCSNNSPAFIIIAVGSQMLGNVKTGILLYIAVIASSYITAFIFSFILPYEKANLLYSNNTNSLNVIDSIKDSVLGIINICGIVVVCYSLCKVVSLYTQSSLTSVLFGIFFEVTTACKFIYDTFGKNLYFICIALTLCPLSTYLQIKYFDKNKAYSFKVLMLSKLFQVPVSLCILRILINIFPVPVSAYANGDIHVNMYWNNPHISIYLFILSICFVIMFERKTKVFTKNCK